MRLRKLLIVAAMFATGVLSSCHGSDSKDAPKDDTKNDVKNVADEPKVNVKIGKFESEECVPVEENGVLFAGDCSEELVCVPDIYDESKGSCQLPCGEKVGENFKKDASLCPAGRSCMVVTSLYADELGAFCMQPQTERDGPCVAVADKDACTNGRTCQLGEVEKDDAGVPLASGFICRDTCVVTPENKRGSCAGNEICMVGKMDTAIERDANNPKKPRACVQENCGPDSTNCECTKAEGFFCGKGVNVCIRVGGTCVEEVRWTSANDLKPGDFTGEICNEKSGHRFCNTRLLGGLETPAQPICMPVTKTSDNGICLAMCSTPSLDRDGDGVISEAEKGARLSCPANYECKHDLPRKMGMSITLKDPANPSVPKSCDPAQCETNKPCPAQCGVGDAECTTVETKKGAMSYCSAPMGSCEPVETPAAPTAPTTPTTN
jgi:hypothetical protein